MSSASSSCEAGYSVEQRAFYAEYRAKRAQYRPPGCHGDSESCWVVAGPPALSGKVCRRCRAQPRSRSLRWVPD